VTAVLKRTREATTARVALIAVALAVVNDAFIHREPGTSMTDHLASGLLPAGAVVGVAVVFPRLRPGARAVAALVCGSLAIVAGVADGGLLGLAVGVALLGLGATVLWRSRRTDGRRYARRALLAAAAVLGAYFVVLPLALAIVINHKARSAVEPADLGVPYRAISLTTEDGLTLAGWYAPSHNGAAVIVFPGRKGPVRHARLLARHGYGVLMLDRRGEGESEGDYNARGWGGEPDLEAAIDYLADRADVESGRIGGLGLSVGGELLLQTAARDERLHAVVSEGAGRQSLADQLQTPDVPKAVRWLSPMTMETAAGVVLANRMPPEGLVDVIPRIAPRPVLLISGGRGNADEELNSAYRDAGGSTVTHWEIAQAGHTGGLAAAPVEYERRVVGFFDEALLGR
jgi:alpha/beta superfamily hydrolase